MTQTLIIAAIYAVAAIELLAMTSAEARRVDRLRWGCFPNVPHRRITRALQRFVNWCDTIQPRKESR